MNIIVLISLLGACLALMILERTGMKTALELRFKGDVKRETRWLAQYGQGACTLAVAAVMWRLDQAHHRQVVATLAAVFGAGLIGLIIKRLTGRVRPGRENAGRFLGFTLKHENARESFPSTHSASAVALTVCLAALYPGGAEVFWVLAIGCAVLRYIMDAHWPSDVLGGIALGYACGHWAMRIA